MPHPTPKPEQDQNKKRPSPPPPGPSPLTNLISKRLKKNILEDAATEIIKLRKESSSDKTKAGRASYGNVKKIVDGVQKIAPDITRDAIMAYTSKKSKKEAKEAAEIANDTSLESNFRAIGAASNVEKLVVDTAAAMYADARRELEFHCGPGARMTAKDVNEIVGAANRQHGTGIAIKTELLKKRFKRGSLTPTTRSGPMTPMASVEPKLLQLVLQRDKMPKRKEFIAMANSLIKGTKVEESVREYRKKITYPAGEDSSDDVLSTGYYYLFMKRHKHIIDRYKWDSSDAKPKLIRTALTLLLDVTHPILSAPMCGMAMGKLAGSVAAAGGVGLIGVGSPKFFTPERVSIEWQIAQEQIRKNNKNGNIKGALGFGFLENFMVENPNDDASFDFCLSLKPDVIFLSGFVTDAQISDEMQSKLIQTIRTKSESSKIIIQTFTVQEAVEAAKIGADVVVLQGADAGGHGRQRDNGASIISLIPQARLALQQAAAQCVLVAAGGIATGQQMAAALLLGADGVHVGSAFVVTEESLAKDEFKQRIFDTKDGTAGTVVSTVWDKLHKTAGGPFLEGKFTGRALSDSESLRRFGEDDGDWEPTEADKKWYAQSNYSARAVWISTSSGLINGPSIKAGKLVTRMMEEAAVALKGNRHFEVTQPEKVESNCTNKEGKADDNNVREE